MFFLYPVIEAGHYKPESNNLQASGWPDSPEVTYETLNYYWSKQLFDPFLPELDQVDFHSL
jgi:hypothetical protein